MGLERKHGANQTQKAHSTEYRSYALSTKEQHTLIRHSQAGDMDAWGKLWENFSSDIYNHIYFINGDKHRAEDLTGDVFVKAQESLPTFTCRPDTPPKAWFLRIAYHKAINEKNKAWRTRVTLCDPVDLDDQKSALDPEEIAVNIIANEESKKRLQSAMKQLKPKQREVVERHFLSGQPYVQIAQEMNTSVGNIRQLLHR